MAFRDDKDAAKARVDALEADLKKARQDLANLERRNCPAAAPVRVLAPERIRALLMVLLTVGGAAAILVYGAIGSRGEVDTLTWRGQLLDPGRTHLPSGTPCRLDLRVQGGDGAVNAPWRVALRCGGQLVVRREDACCRASAPSRCRLEQQRQGASTVYAAACDDQEVWIDTFAGTAMVLDGPKVAVPRWSVVSKRRLFGRDGLATFVERRDDGP
jgi:hypothetical protein